MYQILQKFDIHWHDGGPSIAMMCHLRRVSDLLYNWKSCLLCYMKDVVLHCSIFFKWNKLVRVRVRVREPDESYWSWPVHIGFPSPGTLNLIFSSWPVECYPGPPVFDERFSIPNATLMKKTTTFVIPFIGHPIAPKLCTCHDSKAVASCAKFHSDPLLLTRIASIRNFHRIGIMRKNSSDKFWWNRPSSLYCSFMRLC